MKVSFRCPEWIDKSKVAFAVNGKKAEATLTDGYLHHREKVAGW